MDFLASAGEFTGMRREWVHPDRAFARVLERIYLWAVFSPATVVVFYFPVALLAAVNWRIRTAVCMVLHGMTLLAYNDSFDCGLVLGLFLWFSGSFLVSFIAPYPNGLWVSILLNVLTIML